MMLNDVDVSVCVQGDGDLEFEKEEIETKDTLMILMTISLPWTRLHLHR